MTATDLPPQITSDVVDVARRGPAGDNTVDLVAYEERVAHEHRRGAGHMPVAQPARVHVPPTVSLVIPTLNEARNLHHLALRLPTGLHQIVIVDGKSTDGTAHVARELWPQALVLQQARLGKGNALACGFAACTGEIIVMIDADGSTDPHEIAAFVAALEAGADMVKGSRFVAWGGSADITRLRALGNRVLSLIVNRAYHTAFTDLCYGYNAFWRVALPSLGLEPDAPGDHRWGDGFEIETLMALRSVKAGLRIKEVPSFERSRMHGVSNLRALSDGLRVLRTIRREWTRPGRRNW